MSTETSPYNIVVSKNKLNCYVQPSECTQPIDIILLSSDKQIIGAHKHYLEFFSQGFPPAEFGSTSGSGPETVQMPEKANVLELMVKFMHRNQRHPDLSNVAFKVLLGLAEAAEKYEIYGAVEICRVYLKYRAENGDMTERDSFDLLAFGIKHDYKELSDIAALKTIQVCKTFPVYKVVQEYYTIPDLIVPWVKYHTAYQNIALSIMQDTPPVCGLHTGGIADCKEWFTFYNEVKTQFGFKLYNLYQFGDIYEEHKHVLNTCPGIQCKRRAERWSTDIMSKVSRIPIFSEIKGYQIV